MSTKGVPVGCGRAMPDTVGTPVPTARVTPTLPPVATGTRVGVGNMTGAVMIGGTGMRGQFTMAALKRPEPEALTLLGSPWLVTGITIVFGVVSTGVIVTTGAIVIGGAVVTAAGVVTATGIVTRTGMGTMGIGIMITTLIGPSLICTTDLGNKSFRCRSLALRVLRAASQ